MAADDPSLELFNMLKERVFKKKSKRDLQVMIGPSNLGDPCDRCLGLALAGRFADGPLAQQDRFSMAAWVGTAIHEKMERDGEGLIEGLEWEVDLEICKIKGYGRVGGHADLFWTRKKKKRRLTLAADNKTAWVAKIREYSRAGAVSPKYEVQRQAYGLGAEIRGDNVDRVANFFWPRDSNDLETSWQQSAPYNPKIVHKAVKRAEMLVEKYVVTGRVELLQSDPKCFQCNSFSRDIIIGKRPAGV